MGKMKFFDKVRCRFFAWLAAQIFPYLIIGAHCGMCGASMPNTLALYFHPWDACDKCLEAVGGDD